MAEKETKILARYWFRIVLTWLVWLVAVGAGGLVLWRRLRAGPVAVGSGVRVVVDREKVTRFEQGWREKKSQGTVQVIRNPF